MVVEKKRLREDRSRTKNWKRWGPYLSERQWSTVREDYSRDGNCWDYFPHDHARSRAYRWGEDGLMGITDRQCRLCLALALWNTKDKILKERLFGLTGSQGNHGEDVKELYYYLDSTPTHSYMMALYKYPQAEFPYSKLIHENGRRTTQMKEYEILDTGIFDNDDYWDIKVEYCKTTPNDILGRYKIINRSSETRDIYVLPQLWFRNVWSWGDDCDAWAPVKPHMHKTRDGKVSCKLADIGQFNFEVDVDQDGNKPQLIFTENETNYKRLFGGENKAKYVKDAFHNYIIQGDKSVVNPENEGTKCAAVYKLRIEGGESFTIRLRLYHLDEAPGDAFLHFNEIFKTKIHEANEFYEEVIPFKNHEEQNVVRQAYAGILWSKQFYHYVVKEWLRGDKNHPKPPIERCEGRNHDWQHLFNRDVISVPDKWEYPWYASWDLAFHMIPFANIDIHFAKEQLLLFLREWYMHPNGQIPAYEFSFDDVNPPVHAWACINIYRKSGERGYRDVTFLARCFHKLVLNFTWWVNRKDPAGRHVFTGGFLGLDNIGLFDRSKPLPTDGFLLQADATAWMAFYCAIMLDMSLTLAKRDVIYEDMASKFFEHFVAIVDAMNKHTERGLWNETDGFYYDHIHHNSRSIPLKVRSMVGLVPLFTCFVLKETELRRHPGFYKRTKWFLEHRKDLKSTISFMAPGGQSETLLLAIVTKEKLIKILSYILDENEFLSPYGIRSLSKYHEKNPVFLHLNGTEYSVEYSPGESKSKLFGGNSNWRGPIWLPMNYLLIDNLQRYDYFYGDSLQVECPTGSGKKMRLKDVARELSYRVSKLVVPDIFGSRACHGEDERYTKNPHFKDLVLFYEYFHAETGRGCGASHQTGWTALVVNLLKCSHDNRSLSSDSTSSLCSGDINDHIHNSSL
ncbi:hypothetical protein SNE40_004222 [Patella caerulea]|uniref:Glycosyl hydrolase family 63 C-terminal domain-containing protein n=1 Tax=Patella caerulea TaxID=87958 RepID=A0AAN8Q6D6_PATCE